jgi:hypothetical protein
MQLVVVEVCARCSKLLPFAVLATVKPVSAASTQATLRPPTAVTSLTATGSISQPRPKRKALKLARAVRTRCGAVRQYRMSGRLDAR